MPARKKPALRQTTAPVALRTLDQEIRDFSSILFPRAQTRYDPRDRYEAFLRILRCYWPLEVDPKGDHWNPWTERILRELCSDRDAVVHRGTRVKCTYLTGNAAASKTWSVGWYAFAWWMIDPAHSTVVFTSTTKDMIKRRIWPSVQYYHDNALDPENPGSAPQWPFEKTESQSVIEWRDDWADSRSGKSAIIVMAVAHGETQKAATNLRGLHNQRFLLVVDEANGTPEAILETIPNQRKGCIDYQAVVIGNPVSRLDPHGQCCAPAQGWPIVNETLIEWGTAGVDKWQLEPGVCLRFDGRDSPNVKLGEDKWPFLYTTADWARACRADREKTLAYWSQDRGLWPPDGASNTIFSEVMWSKYGSGSLRFDTRPRPVAFLDPAFGGDDCVLQFGLLGIIAGTVPDDLILRPGDPPPVAATGKWGIQLTERLVVPMDYASPDERDYVVARFAIEQCKRRGVDPQCFGVDRTGTGRGVAAIIAGEWSRSIQQVEFGAAATDRPSSTADHRPANEVYADRVTEMWWEAREFLQSGQLKGVDDEAAAQGCARIYEMRGRKYKLLSKVDFKATYGYSPDEMDAVAGVVDAARSLGAAPLTSASRSRDTAWEEAGREAGLPVEWDVEGEEIVPVEAASNGWAEEPWGSSWDR